MIGLGQSIGDSVSAFFRIICLFADKHETQGLKLSAFDHLFSCSL
jgi:hypothetical protein